MKCVYLEIITKQPSVPLLTNNSEELVGAAVREEASHGVPTWEGGQTLLTILMGLEVEGRKQQMKMGCDTDFTCCSAGLC